MGNAASGNTGYNFARQSSTTSVVDLAGPRQHEELDEEIAIANPNPTTTNNNTSNQQTAVRNPPAPNLYFGSQFFMGSGSNNNNPPNAVSRTMSEESLLGAIRPDLSFLSSLTGARPPAPQLHQITTVKCPVNLHKNSLHLLPIDESNKKLYKVQFTFDSTETITATVHYAVTESTNEQGELIFSPPTTNTSKSFERGLKQSYEQPSTEYFDASLFKSEELVYSVENNYYPVVIVLHSTVVEDSIVEEKKPSTPINDNSNSALKATTQITYAAIIHCADDTYVIKPIKQKIKFQNKVGLVHEIYGLESADNDGGKECVICMTEPRDTVVLPCRHMCLCNSCAEVLRHQSNKCPICRSTVRSMVEVKVAKKTVESDVEIDSVEEEQQLIKKPKDKITDST